MSDNLSGLNFYAELLGKPSSVEVSKDGKAISLSGEIAWGIPMSLTIRPSKSMGSAVDANIDGNFLKHRE